jgi:uncharacterized delta-60 repeat protein
VVIQADGRIVVAVDRAPSNVFAPIPFSGLLRYNSNGSLDSSFRPNCGVTGPLHAVAIQSDGKILAAGGVGATTIPNSVGDFALVRCRADGTFDTGFGTGGVARADFGGCEGANGMAVQPDGRIVLVGGLAVGLCIGPASDAFFLALYNANGSLDAGFGVGGKVVSYFGGGSAGLAPRAVAIQSDGKIVAAGQFDNGDSYNFALVRYQAGGVGGLGFGIAPQPSSVALGWAPGSGQSGYVLARSPSAAWPLPAGATAYLDSASAPAQSLNCYQLFPLGASSALAASDVLCSQLGVRSQVGPPPGFALRLDESTTARLTWGSSGDQLGYVLLALPQGRSSRTLGLAASARWATDQTGGTPTCYVLYAVYAAGLGNSDLACAVPGRASFGAAGPAAQGVAATPQAARTVAAPVIEQQLAPQLQAGKAQVEDQAGKLRRKGR